VKPSDAVKVAIQSLDHKTAPRYSKEEIEGKRAELKQALEQALIILKEVQK
jgi:hypothetical protein